jgi:hypothetical protein
MELGNEMINNVTDPLQLEPKREHPTNRIATQKASKKASAKEKKNEIFHSSPLRRFIDSRKIASLLKNFSEMFCVTLAFVIDFPFSPLTGRARDTSAARSTSQSVGVQLTQQRGVKKNVL